MSASILKQLALRNNQRERDKLNVVARMPARARTRIRRWQVPFLRALAKTPSVTAAAKAAGITRKAAYDLRERDEAFRSAWDDALNQSLDTLEHAAFQRALKGDVQLIALFLKAHRPFYRDSSKLEIDSRLVGVLVVPEKEQKEP